MSAPGHRRRGGAAVALAASLLVHAALLAWVFTRPPPRFPAVMVVELRSGVRVEKPPASRPAPPAARGEREGLAREEGAAQAPVTAGASGRGAADALTRWLPVGPGGSAAPASGAPLATPMPRDLARADAPATPQERVGDLLESMRAEDLRRYPDASWTDLRDALGGGFAPPMSALERAHALSGGPGAGPGLLGRFIDGYGPAAARYGKTGSSIAPGPGAPGVREDSTPSSARQVAVAGAIGSREREALATAVDGLSTLPGPNAPTELSGALVTVVSVRLDAAGAVTAVRLVAKSGSPAYDRAVLERAERVLGRKLSRRLAGTVTEWAFATEVRIQPVAPGAAFTFDDALRPTEGFFPLRRVARTRVELRAVRPG